MFKILHPDMCVDSVLDIPVEELRQKNITSFILDLDNTMTEWNSNQVRPEIVAWVGKLKEMGCKACIVSNNKESRVKAVAHLLDVPYVCRAGKPLRRAFRKALEQLDSSASQTSVVGDQIFTDVLGGNLMGMLTILVSPLNPREFVGTRLFLRNLEKLVRRSNLRASRHPEASDAE